MGRKKWRQYQELLLKSVRQDSMETIDWEPTGRCNLCLEKGEDPDASAVPRPPSESASVSSRCSVERDSNSPQVSVGMTTLESVASSMAASLAAVAALTSVKPSGPPIYPPHLFPHWYLSQTQIPEPVPKSKSPMVMALPPSGPEQPLDLSKSSIGPSAEKSPEPAESTSPLQHLAPSSLGCSQSLKVPSLNRQIYKAKPRISAVAGRRTYTEDELQAALRDIQSGKLGTRRAAVIYGIPRSTLRNKVYKLAMERERDSHLVIGGSQDLVAVSTDDLREEEDEERDLSGAEEEREVEKALRKPLLSMEDIIRISGEGANFPGTDSLRTLLQHGSKFLAEQKKDDGSTSPPIYSSNYNPNTDMWSGIEHSALGPYLTHLFGGNINSLSHPNHFTQIPGSGSSPNERSPTDSPGDFLPKFPAPIELVRRMMVKERLMHEENQKKEQRQFQLNGSRPCEPGPSSSGANHETSHDETSGSATPPNVILRIPSFKPTSKNGVAGDSTGYPIAVKVGESSQHSVLSPPISGTRSESSSPPGIVGKGISVSLRDVIAKSISQKFQQPTDLHHMAHTPTGLEHFRRNEFTPPLGCNPPLIRNHNNNNLDDRKMHPSSVKPSPSGNTSSSTGGKGTRPKRGKYRNYDRDSLVEAVRAVQRGEMSVHRAGSYYGVPHSTLEYKVKERHLMRPRKREPKPPQEEIKRKDEANIVRIPPGEKCKPLPPKPPKAPFTPPSPLAGPNGLKIPPIFDPSLSYSGGPPFPFWPPTPFHHHLPMEYPRGPNFNPSPEQFFASQMIQRLQEDSTRSSQSPPPTLGKTARELAEKLYDGTGANGSFLDGIIRSSLETGLPLKNKEGENISPDRMSNKALLDQLCINSRLTPLLKPGSVQETNSSDDDGSKRAQYQNTSTVNPSPTPHESLTEFKTEFKTEPEEEKPIRSPTLNVETASDVNSTDETKVKTEDIDESACDSKHTITRVDEAKVEEKEIRS